MAKPSITHIRPPVNPGGVAEFDLNTLPSDDFYALSGTDTFDGLVAQLNLGGSCLTVEDLAEYDYVFFGSNGMDLVTGDADASGVIATGNQGDEVQGGTLDDVIFAGNGMDTVRGGAGGDIIFGENSVDKLCGNDGDDKAVGGNGKDTIHGGAGNDTLRGSNGGDLLVGGDGEDSLTGGLGGDQFQFGQTTHFGDTITDFTAGSDTLVFDVGAEGPEISIGNDDTVVDNFVAGDDAAINVADTEVAVKTDVDVATADIQTTIDGYDAIETGALFAFLDSDEGHAVLYYDADPSTAGDAVLVAHLDNITTLDQLAALSASDFVFV
jgi:Ca2+-binding RTX toxin-like protein